MPVAMFNGQPIFGPRGPAGPDGNPIGAVISYMGLTAPQDYLICDGAEHEILQYPELAKFFESQLGTSNHFGGDGVTTFAVPDLRNLFLRGHHGEAEEQLSGEIGEKQEATQIPMLTHNRSGSSSAAIGFISSNKREDSYPYYTDGVITPNDNLYRSHDIESVNNAAEEFPSNKPNVQFGDYFSTRPVNVAVLYCIKAVTSVQAYNVYSTEEQVVGRWINGKMIYRKVLKDMSPSSTDTFKSISTIANVEDVVNIFWTVKNSADKHVCGQDKETFIGYNFSSNTLDIYVVSPNRTNQPFTCIFEYTKTTD